MDYQFSSRITNVKPSAVREILKMSSDPSIIAFSAGNPSQEAFPVEELRRWTAEILAEEPILALQYSVSEGYGPLRQRIRDFLRQRYNVGSPEDQILVCTGAEQALDLLTKVLCNEGDAVLCESPSFVGALNTFRSYGTQLVGVEMDEDGINLEKLEAALQQNKRIRFMYLIPNFQNPMGTTMSLEKRRAVLELSRRYNVPIVEDNPYGDLRFAGEDVPAIKSMDNSGNVIYVGSFSKVLSPGLRVAYLCAPQQLLPKLTVAKQCSDVHTPMLNQLICLRFLTELDFDAHIARCCDIYRHKYELAAQGIREHFSPKVAATKPQGGLFLWVSLPEGADGAAFAKEATARGVAVVPGSAFLMDDSQPCSAFRLNYSTVSDEKLCRGLEILGQLTRELFD